MAYNYKFMAGLGRVSRVADTELILLIARLIRPPGAISGVG